MSNRIEKAIKLLTSTKAGLTTGELWDEIDWKVRPSTGILQSIAERHGFRHFVREGTDGVRRHWFESKARKPARKSARKTTGRPPPPKKNRTVGKRRGEPRLSA